MSVSGHIVSVSGHIVSVSGHIVSWPFEVASSEHFGLELHFNMAAMIVYTKVAYYPK